MPRWGLGPGGVADLGHCSRALSHEKRLLLPARAARVPPGCLELPVGPELGECGYTPHHHASRFSNAQGHSGQGHGPQRWTPLRFQLGTVQIALWSCPLPRIHTQQPKTELPSLLGSRCLQRVQGALAGRLGVCDWDLASGPHHSAASWEAQ